MCGGNKKRRSGGTREMESDQQKRKNKPPNEKKSPLALQIVLAPTLDLILPPVRLVCRVMAQFPNVNRALLFGTRSVLYPNRDFPLETAALPRFAALPPGTGSMPTARTRRVPGVQFSPHEHDQRLLFPLWLLDVFALPPTFSTSTACLSLANAAVTIPEMMLYERRGGVNYVKAQMLPASLAVVLIIMADLGDVTRAEQLCKPVSAEAFATGKSLALSVLGCLNEFYRSARTPLPTTPREAMQFNKRLAGATLGVSNSALFPDQLVHLGALCFSLGTTPALHFRLSLPAAIALLAVMFSEPALWATGLRQWSPTFPSAISLKMNNSVPAAAHAIFSTHLMPSQIVHPPQGAEIPVPAAHTLTNLMAMATTSLGLVRRRHRVLAAAALQEGSTIPPLPADLPRLVARMFFLGTDPQRIYSASDDDLYISNLMGAAIGEVLHLFTFRDTVTPHDFVTELLDPLSPNRNTNPHHVLCPRKHVTHYAQYRANPDMRTLACLEPQMAAKVCESADAAALVAAVQGAIFTPAAKPLGPAWTNAPVHCSTVDTPLRKMPRAQLPVRNEWSTLATVAHVATLRGYTLMTNLQPEQIRHILLLRRLARNTSQCCLLGASDRLFDLETESAGKCVLLSANVMRLLVLHMAYYSKYAYYNCTNAIAVPLARELLCLPQPLGVVMEDQGDARFVDELAFMIVRNLTRYPFIEAVLPEGTGAPMNPRYGFTRIRTLYKVPGEREPAKHFSGLALPMLEYLVRPLLTGDHIHHRASFSRTTHSDVLMLCEWLALAAEIPSERLNQLRIPSLCIQQLVIRFAYVLRTNQLSNCNGALNRAAVMCHQNPHMVHAITMLTLSIFKAEHNANRAANDDYSDADDDMFVMAPGQEELDDERDAQDTGLSAYVDARAFRDAEKTQPLWSSAASSAFLDAFYRIPLDWFASKIIVSDAELERKLQQDTPSTKFSVKLEAWTERAAASTATFGLCFGDIGSLSVLSRSAEKAIVSTVKAVRSGLERDDMTAELEAAAGRPIRKISQRDDYGFKEPEPSSKRQTVSQRRKTTVLESADRYFSMIDKMNGDGVPLSESAKAKFEEYNAEYTNFDREHLLFERICRDHNVVTGSCPRDLRLYYEVVLERYREVKNCSRWLYLLHLAAFLLSWSLHADRPTFLSPTGSGARVEVVPRALFRQTLQSAKVLGLAGKQAVGRRNGVHSDMIQATLDVAADAPPPLFDNDGPWKVRPLRSGDEVPIRDTVTAVAWLEIAAHTKTPEAFVRPDTLKLPDNWLGAALPMCINKQVLRYGVDWPASPMTEAEFKAKHFDLAASEELRNTALLMDCIMPNAGRDRVALPPLLPASPHAKLYDYDHRCHSSCMVHRLSMSQCELHLFGHLVYMAREQTAATDAAVPMDLQ